MGMAVFGILFGVIWVAVVHLIVFATADAAKADAGNQLKKETEQISAERQRENERRKQAELKQRLQEKYSAKTGEGSSGISAELSTMEMLRAKQAEDTAEHEREHAEEQQRLRKETGGRKVGMKYNDWNEIPKGKMKVKCGYCGAENLIKLGDRKSAYTCYFCREVLGEDKDM